MEFKHVYATRLPGWQSTNIGNVLSAEFLEILLPSHNSYEESSARVRHGQSHINAEGVFVTLLFLYLNQFQPISI